jgi:hypothetical protein
MILYLPYVKAFTAFLEEKLNYTRRESTNIKNNKATINKPDFWVYLIQP